ncbi:uncharacterized protein [Rutidosis leptorrhynchoides]|uniref:uncharacterized protein n=1 Tax=Rutidosis leptorrhynchoides TaxID=125765 RepID=UPI003A99147F
MPVKVLFDSGADRSFIATRFAPCLCSTLSSLKFPLEVEIADDKPKLVVGMDWLSQYGANIVCDENIIRVKTPSGEDVIIQGEGQRQPVSICTYARARRLMSSGCAAFLAHVIDSQKESKSIKDIPVVNEFEDVFPDDLPGVPPERQVEF